MLFCVGRIWGTQICKRRKKCVQKSQKKKKKGKQVVGAFSVPFVPKSVKADACLCKQYKRNTLRTHVPSHTYARLREDKINKVDFLNDKDGPCSVLIPRVSLIWAACMLAKMISWACMYPAKRIQDGRCDVWIIGHFVSFSPSESSI